MDYGPTDITIKEVIHDEKGWWFSGEETHDFGSDVTFDAPYDIADAYAIQTITQKVPETDEVKDATVPQPQVVSLLDQDDLKQRGFDGSHITNEQLAEIASKMNNYYLDYSFWDDMESACKDYNVPRLNEEETEE